MPLYDSNVHNCHDNDASSHKAGYTGKIREDYSEWHTQHTPCRLQGKVKHYWTSSKQAPMVTSPSALTFVLKIGEVAADVCQEP